MFAGLLFATREVIRKNTSLGHTDLLYFSDQRLHVLFYLHIKTQKNEEKVKLVCSYVLLFSFEESNPMA